MKIDIENTGEIAAALDRCNGKAIAHTFTAKDLRDIRTAAEKHLDRRHVNKGERRHVTITATSGYPLPNSYKQSRIVNRATLTFSADGGKCYLTTLEKRTQWPSKDGKIILTFTTELEGDMKRRFIIAARTI